MEGKAILSKLTPYQQGKQMQEIKETYGLERIVKLASNENPYGFSPEVGAFFQSGLHDLNVYPDGYTKELRINLANKLKLDETQLIFGSGSEEIVQMICRAFLYPGTNTVMAAPTFPQYKHNALIEGAAVKEVPLRKGEHNLDQMLREIDGDTKVAWLCSPNNPSGTVIPKDALQSFLNECPDHVLVVLDEAYYEFMDEDPESIGWLSSFNNLIILRTFSKAYGLAGLRIGYGISNPDILKKIDVVRGPFNTTSIAQKAAIIALEDQGFIKNIKQKNKEVKREFESFLDKIGWSYFPSQTNFLLVSTPVSGMEVFEYLLARGFIVRPGELLGIPNTIRVTIGKEKDMGELKDILLAFHQNHLKEI
ncbi:histidinol-phosphate transaminase [Virgibacillus sp. YIM 98842]|jgi:histidinol-phosphate aminotransferase|uniref:histidinol-phosphate transaminase n=1 Tax=Virgibacillus sp. YIM 98842 TaxID=2663533 RepID=UPI0013D94448|nr:histidinol-phosphate transaminase [Virgibacillus sp. YIM 98842]